MFAAITPFLIGAMLRHRRYQNIVAATPPFTFAAIILRALLVYHLFVIISYYYRS
jgi:hypothetical protein